MLERPVGNNMTNYPLGDFLIRVKNVSMARGREVSVRSTRQIEEVAKCLKRAGFLAEVKKEKDTLTVSLAYAKKAPVMMGLNLVTKPGLRIYKSVGDLMKEKGPSILLLHTPKGIYSSKEAKKENVAGEVIAKVW